MNQTEQIKLTEKLSSAYLAYSVAVITDRALPDIRDGMKPVTRRILYAMYKMGLHKSSQHKKCARIVGEVLGKFHPHSDSSVYGALVKLAQDFNMMHPLIDGQGSFGSVDDGAAAMRYTEARLENISELLLEDLEYNTVNFIDNFDGSLKEPVILPVRFPHLLINGSSGIAVGMKTDIPSHNLREIIDATVLLIENPDASIPEILKCIKGPDFPTGGLIKFDTPKEDLYSTGRGSVILRAKIEEVEVKRRNGLQISELPYLVSKEDVMKKIIKLIKEKKLEGALDLRDESDKEGTKIIIEFSRKIEFEEVVNILYRHTKLEDSFSCNFLALLNGSPMTFNIKNFLATFIEFRVDVSKKYFAYQIIEKEKRKNILEGYKKIIDNIEDVIHIIRKSEDNDEIKKKLKEKYALNDEQVVAILETKLSKLSKLEENNLKDELKQLNQELKDLNKMVSDRKNILGYIKDDLLEIKNKFGKPRLCKVI